MVDYNFVNRIRQVNLLIATCIPTCETCFPLLIMSQDAASSLKEANTRNYCYRIRVKGWSYVKKILTGYTGHWLTFVLWIISISLDPFICYVPSIQDDEKLLKINSSLLIGLQSGRIYRATLFKCVAIFTSSHSKNGN
ncbi:hypothetical protein Q3G72_023966 [Acer saccharum]|nr:hypothetical protein Q3G72_023966 [Acer saccharum]